MASTLFSILIVIIFAIIAGIPLLHEGLHPTHDGEYHVIRFYEFFKTLQDGNIYPRWAADLNNGYGLPLFNYVYPLPNYIASFFHLLGTSFINAFKLSMFSSLLIGAVFFYLWSRKFWGDIGGIVCSVFYTFSPYHFVDIYVRGSIGEVWALAFFPVLLWTLSKVFQEKNRTYSYFSAAILGLIIFSHNILALMFFMFILTYMLFFILQSKEKKYMIINSILIICLGLCLSMIFWLPALLERSYVVGLEVYSIENKFPQLYQLLFPSWGTGFSETSLGNQTSYQIGIANLVSIILSAIVAIVFFLKKKLKLASLVAFFLIWFFLVFFLMQKASLPIWHTIPFMNYFQFPWRLLSIEILIASFLAGSIIKIWPSKIIALILIIFALLLSIQYTKPAYYHLRDDNYYITRSNFIHGTNSPGNTFNTTWFNRKLQKPKEKIKIKSALAEKKSELLKTTQYIFSIHTEEKTEVVVNTAYFPGWMVFINDKKIEAGHNNDGLIQFSFPKGEHRLEIEFQDSPTRKIAIVVSLLSFLFLVTLFIKKFYDKIKR